MIPTSAIFFVFFIYRIYINIFLRTNSYYIWPAGKIILPKTNICLDLISIANTQQNFSTGTENWQHLTKDCQIFIKLWLYILKVALKPFRDFVQYSINSSFYVWVCVYQTSTNVYLNLYWFRNILNNKFLLDIYYLPVISFNNHIW